LLMGMLVIGFDTSMFKRTPVTSAVETNSGEQYVRSQQKKNPHRKIIYYGTGLLLQYVCSFHIV
jgi:hypothetical protein